MCMYVCMCLYSFSCVFVHSCIYLNVFCVQILCSCTSLCTAFAVDGSMMCLDV